VLGRAVLCCAVLCCAAHRFVKLCKAAAKSRDGDDAPPIVFLKHNVYDDEDEEVTPLAKKYNVRVSQLDNVITATKRSSLIVTYCVVHQPRHCA
jgi:hypothetical protein